MVDMLYATGEPFDHLVEDAYPPLKRTNADTLIVAMNTPGLSFPGIEARREAIDLRAQFRDMLCIRSPCQQEWDSRRPWITLVQDVFNRVEQRRLQISL